MKRVYKKSKICTAPIAHLHLHEHVAYHEAGHVTAIYLRNQQQKLPPVFFQITFNNKRDELEPYFAKVDGGRLIESLAIAEIENTENLVSDTEQAELQNAYEADIINLLAGPLAEAKFVALRDDEVFNPHLVNLWALNHYGGSYDLEQAHQYLNCFIADAKRREAKLKELFEQAFNFVNKREHWQCIEFFAKFLLNNEQRCISCDEASTIFELFLTASKRENDDSLEFLGDN